MKLNQTLPKGLLYPSLTCTILVDLSLSNQTTTNSCMFVALCTIVVKMGPSTQRISWLTFEISILHKEMISIEFYVSL